MFSCVLPFWLLGSGVEELRNFALGALFTAVFPLSEETKYLLSHGLTYIVFLMCASWTEVVFVLSKGIYVCVCVCVCVCLYACVQIYWDFL